MPYQPQRFIHAANIRLDVPVSVYLSEQLTDDLRHQLEDATLLAFDCVTQNCIEHQVDYLLLSGNVFVEADRSLRARLALLKGFRELQKEAIPVFVIPGDTDPPDAWRSIPDLPANVSLCFTSSPEPIDLQRGDKKITTVSASMWYGETDAFGIRVIHSSPDGIEPFRIGTVSRSRYDESKRLTSLSAAAEDSMIRLENNTIEPPSDENAADSFRTSDGDDSEYEVGFRNYIRKLMQEGKLNYLALTGELARTEMQLETVPVHCPGITQPRNQLEADSGLCSLVTVDASGQVSTQEINTSAVDWKNITLQVEPGTELNRLLEQMRDKLTETSCCPSDRIWSVCWTLTGPLPVLQNFMEDDLELAVAVELDKLSVAGRSLRLLHQVRMVPDAWDLEKPEHLAQQYADLVPANAELLRDTLISFPGKADLTEGWSRRLKTLADGIDPQRVLAQLRNDGADWFVSDLEELLPPERLSPDTVETESPVADQESEDNSRVAEADSSSTESVSAPTVLTMDNAHSNTDELNETNS
ncbi:MAG: hypothetical protein MK110_08765 [Fuerstiella sp.]|nr:hypothetical protein [Fuerstiella sp.]